MKQLKNQKGITLAILIITVIILLILTAVVVKTGVGENGIADIAKNASNQANQQYTNMQTKMNILKAQES